ncbi:unnamed protein product [Closterium sp. NIES-54]
MTTPRVLRFDADGRPLDFSVWLLRARRLLESPVQGGETLWSHATGDLPEPPEPTALGPAPDDAATARFARQRADRTAWTSRDAAACIALSSLLPESEEVHFTQVRTATAYLTAIKARYSTPATVSLGRLFLPFLFPDLASFERSADLIAHLRSLDASYRAASTEAQLALLPPPMAITIYFIATSLPDRLASVRDALLLKHPSELTIEVLESALKDVESNLRSVAAASGTVSPPLFHGCTVPQLPTFTASLATATTDATAAAVTTTSRSRGRGGKKGVSGGGGGGGSGGSGGAVATGGGGSAASGETPRAAAGDSTAPAGGGNPRARQSPPVLPAPLGGAAAWYQAQRLHHPTTALHVSRHRLGHNATQLAHRALHLLPRQAFTCAFAATALDTMSSIFPPPLPAFVLVPAAAAFFISPHVSSTRTASSSPSVTSLTSSSSPPCRSTSASAPLAAEPLLASSSLRPHLAAAPTPAIRPAATSPRSGADAA